MEEKKKSETSTIKNGFIIIGAVSVLGYMIGRMSANQLAIYSYTRGVSDALNSITFRKF